MRKFKTDPYILDHQEWIAFVRPTGLVVSAHALVKAGAILERRDADGQRRLHECVQEEIFDVKAGPEPVLTDFQTFAREVLGWSFSPKGYAGTDDSPIAEDLEVVLSDGGSTLRPDFAVRELEPQEGSLPWQLLVNVYDSKQDLDHVFAGKGGLELSPSGRMERLLRSTGVAAGLLFNGRRIRLISAPYGESSGWLDFQVRDMAKVAGRPICAAMRMLLNQRRLLAIDKSARLTALLENSRKYQNEVSERLAEQVLHALYEFIRGFQAAHNISGGELLRHVLDNDPDRVYRALLSVLLRIVFLLYAEERDMMPGDETWLRYYALGGLHERLREDAAQHLDTMDQRFGAWAQLLVLFRMVYDGATYGDVSLPQRHGDLFDPERFPLLEGRTGPRATGERVDIPCVSDGTIYRVLEKLLVLDGERLSYRALDVEQIGSVYETMMGFRVEIATGQSVALRAEKKYGAPTTIDLDALLAEPGPKREAWVQDNAGLKLSDGTRKAVNASTSVTDLHAALDKMIDKQATPDKVAKGSLVLQPSEERRRSGSHYTPRSLTEPIVRTTLDPILARLKGANGSPPRQEQILDLKVCDPAMGSGAFLVEACRQLADSLRESWIYHGAMPALPLDEDDVVFARRLVAQRCLYGVDKNPMAVDLAKLSIWLVTLAKDHAFTFLNHCLRPGDSLVGLTNEQILSIHWDVSAPKTLFDETLPDRIRQAAAVRQRIAMREEQEYEVLDEELQNANAYIGDLRLIGNVLMASFFKADKARQRLAFRSEVVEQVYSMFDAKSLIAQEPYRMRLQEWAYWLSTERMVAPFHWQLEFPEVFLRSTPGFDVIVANPPFVDSETMVKDDADYRDIVGSFFKSAKGNWDLYIPFIEQIIKLCNRLGRASAISPNKWLGAPYGIALRELTAGDVTNIVDYSATRAFENIGVAAICTTFGSTENDEVSVSDQHANIHSIHRSTLRNNSTWGLILSNHLDLLLGLSDNAERLGNFVHAHDPFTVSEAYELKELVSEYPGDDLSLYFRLINTGTIDPFVNMWGKSETRYLKDKYMRPVVDRKSLKAKFPKRFEQAIMPKIIASGMRKFESTLDPRGDYLAGKSTIVITGTSESTSLLTVLGLLNSKLIRFYLQECFGVVGVDGGISFSGSIVKDIPVPHGFTGKAEEIDAACLQLLSLIGRDSSEREISDGHAYLDRVIFGAYGVDAMAQRIVMDYEFKC